MCVIFTISYCSPKHCLRVSATTGVIGGWAIQARAVRRSCRLGAFLFLLKVGFFKSALWDRDVKESLALLIDEGINKMESTHTMEYYSALKRKEILELPSWRSG